MPLRIKCPKGHPLTVPSRSAGKWVQCPSCGERTQIPSAERVQAARQRAAQLARLEAAEGPAASIDESPPNPRPPVKVASAEGPVPAPPSPPPAKRPKPAVALPRQAAPAAPRPTESPFEPPRPRTRPEAPPAPPVASPRSEPTPPPVETRETPLTPPAPAVDRSQRGAPPIAPPVVPPPVAPPAAEPAPPPLPASAAPPPPMPAPPPAADLPAATPPAPAALSAPAAAVDATPAPPLPHELAELEETEPELPGEEHPLERLLPAYYVAAALALLALFSMAPGVVEIVDFWRATARLETTVDVGFWAWLVLFLGVVQLAYAGLLAQVPDWSSTWIVSLLALAMAAIYAAGLAVVMLAGPQNDFVLWLELEYVQQQHHLLAAQWCLCIVSLSGMLAWFSGALSWSWQRASLPK